MTFTNNYKLKEQQQYYYILEIEQKNATLKLGYSRASQMKRALKSFNKFYKSRNATLKFGRVKIC